MIRNRQKELIKHISDQELLLNFYLSQLLILILALILGYIFFDSIADPFYLFNFQDIYTIITVGGGAGLIIVIIDVIMMKFLPESFFDDGGINERLFTNRGYLHIVFMCLIVAFCEELLFRGVLQTTFGLLAASIIFAVIHIRYLFNKFLFFSIVLLSFLIGFIFEWTENLAVTFFMHYIIDCLLGIYIRIRNNNKKKSIS